MEKKDIEMFESWKAHKRTDNWLIREQRSVTVEPVEGAAGNSQRIKYSGKKG